MSSPEPDNASGYSSLATRADDGTCALDVMVAGAHCGACIQKIESRLARADGIKSARLNFSTRRLHLEWTGNVDQVATYIRLVQDLGYQISPANDAHAGDIQAEEKHLMMCMAVAGFATGNIMLLSLGLWITTGETMGEGMRALFHFISALIAIPTAIYSGQPFFKSAINVLSRGHTNMDVPISVGVVLTIAVSIFQALQHAEHAYFDAVVMLLFFLLIGRYLDLRARRQARSAATDLLSSLNGFAHVVTPDGLRTLPIRDLREGMQVQVGAGEKFPTDAKIFSGQSSVDESLVTGETIPRSLDTGANVYAGTINLSAPVVIVEIGRAHV